MSGSAIGGMLDWKGATGGATEIIRNKKEPIKNTGIDYKPLQAPLAPPPSHNWRDGESGHIGDTYSKGGIAGTDYKHGKQIQHHTRGPINHSTWRGGENGHVADALHAETLSKLQQRSPHQQRAMGGMSKSNDKTRAPPPSHTWRDGERGHIGDTYTKGGFAGTDYKPAAGKKVQHHTRGPINHSTWRGGERGVHVSDVFKTQAQPRPQRSPQQQPSPQRQQPSPQRQQPSPQRQQPSPQRRQPSPQRQQPSPQRRTTLGRGPPTSPVQIKPKPAATNDSTTTESRL